VRIIAGIAKGTALAVPRGDATRPTSDRTREAIFSSLGERVAGADVLDLFAGTGALGLEAASRGARSVTFVEQSHAALQCLKKNLDLMQARREIGCEFRVLRGEVFSQLAKLKSEFSLIFADPPYGGLAQRLVDDESLPSLLSDGGLLVLESAKRDALAAPTDWTLVREAIYGDTRVSFFSRPAASEPR
jgi:16S rRNA (guanine(966)-N(2))-methyltransferase RsmD